MNEKRSLQAQYEFLALPALQDGLASRQDWERLSLAMLYVKEARKNTFSYAGSDDDQHVKAFLKHVMAAFVESDELKVVLDFQPRLLATAKDLSQRPRPIEAVILYATWCEHWLNATLITTGLARGLSEEDAVQVVREAGIRAKLGWLWRTMMLPGLPSHLGDRILFLSDVRNEHVHYKWKGHDPDVLAATDDRLTLAISDIDALVEGLLAFEIEHLVAPFIQVADRLFSVSIAPHWREAALRRPESVRPLADPKSREV